MRHVGRVADCLQKVIEPRELVLPVWFYLYLVLCVQPHLIYIHRCPLFSLAPSIVRGDLACSGGITELLSRFLGQFYATDWQGSLILTLEAMLIGLLARACLNHLAARPVQHLHLLPMALFMLGCCRYEQQLTLGPAVIVLLAGTVILMRLPWRSPAGRLLCYAFAAGGFYYAVAGASGKLNLVLTVTAFAALGALFQRRHSEGSLAALGWGAATLGVTAGIVYVGERTLLAANAAEWHGWFSLADPWSGGLRVALFLSVPVAGLWVTADPWAFIAARRSVPHSHGARRLADKKAPTAPPPTQVSERARWQFWLLQLIPTAVLLWVVSSLAMYVIAENAGRRNLEMDDCLVHGRWSDLLAAAAAVAPSESNLLTSYDINTALFHLGRLPEDMFAYDQRSKRVTLPYLEPDSFRFLYRQCEMWLELGRVNDAEHIAYEALTQIGPNPYILRQLATLHLVKGEVPGARVYLRVLSDDRVHRQWARRYLRLADDDRLLSSDPEIGRLRQVMLTRDDVQDSPVSGLGDDEERLTPESMLVNLLEKNRKNRMAFEYLMGSYLLSDALEPFARNIHRLDDLGETRIPRAYEEALLVYLDQPGARLDLHGRTISKESTERYRRFKDALAAYHAGQAPADQIANDYNSTFFFYHTFAKGASR